MNLISRYILKEHVVPFFFSLFVIMFVFVTKFVARYIGRLFGKGLSARTIFEAIYLNLAWMMALAVPMAVLVATLMAFGRMSSDNEITVLKTSGISLYRAIRPVLTAAAVLTVIMLWYNNYVLPDFNHRARMLFHSISRKKPTLDLEKGIFLTLNNFNIRVENIQKSFGSKLAESTNLLGPNYVNKSTDRLEHITIFDQSSPTLQRTVLADYGYLVFDKQREQLVFTLFNGEIHEINTRDFSQYRRLTFFRNVFYIPAPDLVFKRENDSFRGDREMNIAMMTAQIKRYKNLVKRENDKMHRDIGRFLIAPARMHKFLSEAAEALPLPEKEFIRPALSRAARTAHGLAQRIRAAGDNIVFYKKQINKYEVEIQKKYSIPFACLVFVLIGAPLGIKARRGSVGVGMTFSVGFFLIYWVCLIGGEELADRRLLSPVIAMWSPNIIVGFFGIFMTLRIVRETTFYHWEKLPKFIQAFIKPNKPADA